MIDFLPDLKQRNIFTSDQLGIRGVYLTGEKILEILKDFRIKNNKLIGVYFTHYYNPPKTKPHVKVGIRYIDKSSVDDLNNLLDTLCKDQKYGVINKGVFEHTTGEYDPLPLDIVVDYVICHGFEFFIKIQKDVGEKLPQRPDIVSNWLLHHRNEINQQVVKARDIFRTDLIRRCQPSEVANIWERFVHHLLNMYRSNRDYELQVKDILRQNGVNIS